jgi:hypothetical protein
MSQTLRIFILIATVVFASTEVNGQYSALNALPGYDLKVYFSKGQEVRAKQMARLSTNAMVYTKTLVGFAPSVTLLILSKDDWSKYTSYPVYGMPHYNDAQTLVVAAEENEFWNSFIPPLDQLPQSLSEQIRQVYNRDGKLTMQPFFDLLALHELGHAFHQQGGRTMQRKWMGELFCNILLHTYIAEKEPSLLPALTVFPNMVVAAGKDEYKFTSLAAFETNYNELGKQYPKNYGWYQSRLHAAAREIYDACGREVLQRLWTALSSNKNIDDQQFEQLLRRDVHPAIADVMVNW